MTHHILTRNAILILCGLLFCVLGSTVTAQAQRQMPVLPTISLKKEIAQDTTEKKDETPVTSISETLPKAILDMDFINSVKDPYGILYKVIHEGEIQDSSELAFDYKVFYPDTIEQANIPHIITVPDAIVSIQKPQKQQNQTLLFYILLAIVGLFTFTKHNYPKYIKELYRSFNNINISRQFFEDQRYSTAFASVLIYVGSLLTFSMTCYILLNYFEQWTGYPDYLAILICLVVVGGFLILKYVVLRLIAFILPLKLTLDWYIFNTLIHNCVMSFALLPIIMIVGFAETSYANTAIVLFIALVIFTFAYRLYIGAVIGKEFLLFHKFHFFIYLCVLEIAPLIIMTKVVQQIVL